jgi:hypothetical protein
VGIQPLGTFPGDDGRETVGLVTLGKGNCIVGFEGGGVGGTVFQSIRGVWSGSEQPANIDIARRAKTRLRIIKLRSPFHQGLQ